MYNRVADIRNNFAGLLLTENFVENKDGSKMIEFPGFFVADEDSIFGTVNEDYVQRELEWYDSQSLKVADIPGETPKIWNQIASKNGEINSNYGYLIYSKENGEQYKNVRDKLAKEPLTRQATMIYNRPSMHTDWNRDGMSDFICTNAVNYLYRGGELHAIVQMRSNDAVFGYKNDFQWQLYVLSNLADDLDIPVGTIFWNAASLHVYERHFDLVQKYIDDNGVKLEPKVG